MPFGVPAAGIVETGCRADVWQPSSGKFYPHEWLPKGRKLTLLYMAAEQDGFTRGHVVALHPAYGDGRCFVFPFGALRQ